MTGPGSGRGFFRVVVGFACVVAGAAVVALVTPPDEGGAELDVVPAVDPLAEFVPLPHDAASVSAAPASQAPTHRDPASRRVIAPWAVPCDPAVAYPPTTP